MCINRINVKKLGLENVKILGSTDGDNIGKRAKMVKDKKKFCTMRQTEKMVKNVFGIRGFKGAFQVKGVQLRVISKSFKTIARITKFHCRLINPKVIF